MEITQPTREQLIELLDGTEKLRQELEAENKLIRDAAATALKLARNGRYAAAELMDVARSFDALDSILANARAMARRGKALISGGCALGVGHLRLVCAQHGHVVNGVQVPCRNTRT